MSSEQVNALTYEFGSIAKKLDFLAHVTKAYSNLFQQRGMTEIEYSKHLVQQCGTPLKTGGLLMKKDLPLDSLEDTIKAALNQFNTSTIKVAQKHNEIGVVLIEQVAKPLDNLQRTLEMNRKRIVNDFIQRNKVHQGLIKAAERACEQYKRAVAELKLVTSQLNIAMTQHVNMVDKLVARKQQAVNKLQNAENIYKQAVEKANAYGEEMYGEPVKKITESSIELFKTHFDSIKNIFTIVSTQCTELVPIADEAFKSIQEEVSKMNFEADLKQFVDANANVHNAYIIEVTLDNILNEAPADNFAAPAAEKKEEAPVEEPKKEEPAPEEKKEEPAEEKKEEEATTEEKKEEEPVEEKKEEQ